MSDWFHCIILSLQQVLFLTHPRKSIRDTSRFKPFRQLLGGGGTPSLKKLSQRLLAVEVQAGEHNSVSCDWLFSYWSVM